MSRHLYVDAAVVVSLSGTSIRCRRNLCELVLYYAENIRRPRVEWHELCDTHRLRARHPAPRLMNIANIIKCGLCHRPRTRTFFMNQFRLHFLPVERAVYIRVVAFDVTSFRPRASTRRPPWPATVN